MRVYIGVSAKGARVGECHQCSKISDATVDLIREMHEDRGRSYAVIARVLKISIHTVAKICRYERRANTPDRYICIDV